MRIKFLISLFIAWTIPLIGGDTTGDSAAAFQMFKTQQELYGEPFLEHANFVFSQTADEPYPQTNPKNYKSPQKGLLFSLVIPGSGELYSGYKIKGAVFLGIEVLAWASYAVHKNKYNDWKQKYQKMADQFWDESRWRTWWESLGAEDQESFPAYTLPNTKNDEYYKLIGKYPKFNAGWIDSGWEEGNPDTQTSPRSLTYMKWRNHSSREYKLAIVSTAAVMANHILSALDAVWSVHQYNKDVKQKVRIKYALRENQPNVTVNLALSW